MIKLFRLCLIAVLPALAARAQVAEQPPADLKQGMRVTLNIPGNLGATDGAVKRGEVKTSRLNVEVSDFTLAVAIEWSAPYALPQGTALVTAPAAQTPPWRLGIDDQGQIVFAFTDAAGEHVLTGPLPPPAKYLLVVASIKRDAKQAMAALTVNGSETSSIAVAPGRMMFMLDGAHAAAPAAQRTRVQFYDRALSRIEALAWSAWAEHECTPPSERPDAIGMFGGTEIVRLMESGLLEGQLAVLHPRTRLRTLAWEGDTVFKQDRPLNYGPLPLQLLRTDTQSVLINFGRQECVDGGAAALPAFIDACRALLKQLPPGPVIGPLPFEPRPPPQRDLSALNETLRAYNNAIRDLAHDTKRPFIDVLAAWPKDDTARTRDGLMLNDEGLRAFARILVDWFASPERQGPGSINVTEPQLRQLRDLASEKEKLWHQYWRPSNWAFLYGDRTTQPSSRDHLNPSVRWFPQELEQYRKLIAAKENELWKLSEELGRKLP